MTDWESSERIRKMSFTQLLDYREDLRNPRLDYVDHRNKSEERRKVELEINERIKK